MPARDRHHDAVKRALIKDGWKIEREQVLFILADRHVWVDMEASNTTGEHRILIEVKGLDGPSQVEALMDAIGQYVVYRAVIDEVGGQDIPLYLAVPESAYQSILSEQIGVVARQQVEVKLVVFDPDSEEIRQWID